MKKPILLIIIITGCLAACKKGDTPNSSLVGRWQWQYTTGGIAGINRTPAKTGNNVILEIKADSTYTNTINNMVDTKGQIHVGPDPLMQPSDYKYLSFSNGMKTEYATKISGELYLVTADTLYLGDGPLVADGFNSKYYRIR